MSVWRFKRKLSYLAGISAFILVVFLIFFFIYKPRPTCFDGIQNQDEEGIDCGGPCVRVCSKNINSLNFLWARPVNVGDNNYSVVSLFENKNNNLVAKNLDYSIKLFDNQNKLIGERVGAIENVWPKEPLIIFESNIATDGVAVRSLVELEEDIWWEETYIEKPSVSVNFKSFQPEPYPRVTATISNDSVKLLSDVDIYVVISDYERNVFAASATLVDSLPGNSSREIFFTWPKQFLAHPVFFDFYPRFDF
jgi:hypothetical protein